MAIPSEPPAQPHPPLAEAPQARILVAEDPFINSFLRTVLTRHGHTVVAGEPFHSSDLLLAGNLAADVVITNLPQAFLPFSATLPVLYIAASPDPELASRFRTCRVLRKPFRNDDLMEAVSELARAAVL
jgi:hypothetical protein